MARPQKCRYICSKPKVTRFFPDLEEAGSVTIGYDEYEVIRLLDYVRLTQEECARLSLIHIFRAQIHRRCWAGRLSERGKIYASFGGFGGKTQNC